MVDCRWSLEVGWCSECDVCCSLYTGCCFCHLLVVVGLFVGCSLLYAVVCRLLFVVCCLLFVGRCLMFVFSVVVACC